MLAAHWVHELRGSDRARGAGRPHEGGQAGARHLRRRVRALQLAGGRGGRLFRAHAPRGAARTRLARGPRARHARHRHQQHQLDRAHVRAPGGTLRVHVHHVLASYSAPIILVLQYSSLP